MIASIDRAGDHAVVLAALVLIVAVGGLVYWLVLLAARRRAGRAHSDRGPEGTGRPDA
jgi:ABC-type nitrate/sulfonate/bicarbonate transport system permease component